MVLFNFVFICECSSCFRWILTHRLHKLNFLLLPPFEIDSRRSYNLSGERKSSFVLAKKVLAARRTYIYQVFYVISYRSCTIRLINWSRYTSVRSLDVLEFLQYAGCRTITRPPSQSGLQSSYQESSRPLNVFDIWTECAMQPSLTNMRTSFLSGGLALHNVGRDELKARRRARLW